MAENRMVVVYTLLASAVATLALAAVFWSRVIDLGDQSETLATLLVVIAIMDLVFVAIFLRRITR
jgi:uncharacterized membrane protein YidH (DUF202 family)